MKKQQTPQEQEKNNRLSQLIGNTEEAKTSPIPTMQSIQQPIQPQRQILEPAPIILVKDQEYYKKLFGIKPIETKGKHLGFKVPLNFALVTPKQLDVFEKVKELQYKNNDTLIRTIIDLLSLGLTAHEKTEKKSKK